MKKIIYSAKDSAGNAKHGFVEAQSNKEALAQLTGAGLSNIVLHDDAFMAFERDELANADKAELERIARFEVSVRNKGTYLQDFILEALRVNKYVVILGVLIAGWGIYDNNLSAITIGALIALSIPAISLWNYRTVSAYDKVLRTSSTGDWEDALKNIKFLRPKLTKPEMAFDLDVREACINTFTQPLPEILQSLEKWHVHFDKVSPGLYESRIAVVYHAAGDYRGFLEKMREGYMKSESPTMIVDLALAEARFGDPDKADLLLAKVVDEELPPHGIPFVSWAKGFVLKRRHDPAAVQYLGSAVSAMSDFSGNPAIWTSLALCTGSYAAALIDNNEVEKANVLVNNVWKILKLHGDGPLLNELSEVSPNS